MRSLIAGLLLVAAGTAQAEVMEAAAGHFQVRSVHAITAAPAKVFEAYSSIGAWWNPDHSWSGQAGNLSREPRAGGCFCEKLADGGSVQHAAVIFAQPGKLLRLSGALGPLQLGALVGNLSLETLAKDGVTQLTLTYTVAGHYPGGLTGIAPNVDAVLREQMTRLKKYVETGKPS